MPFFEVLGFTDGEDVRKKSEIKLADKTAFDGLPSDDSFTKIRHSASSKAKEKDTRYRGPKGKLSSKNRGVKAGGSSGSKSTLSKVSFSGSSSEEDVNISQTGLSAKEKAESAKAYAAMQHTNRLLAQTHRTNSSMDAKSKWDKSFIGGSAAKGKMGYKGGATELDEMSSSVFDLKDVTEGSLSTPDVGDPTKDAAATAKDPALNALKDAANPVDGLVNSLFNNTAKSASSNIGSEEAGANVPPEAMDHTKPYQQPGETGKVSVVDCSTNPSYCGGKTTGSYYQASYDGVDGGYSSADLSVVRGEDGAMTNVAAIDGEGTEHFFNEDGTGFVE
jgi:hypothetical protein